MSLQFFFREQPTSLQVGDIIKNPEGNRYHFYREGERLTILSDFHNHDDAIVLFACVDEFFKGVEAGSRAKIETYKTETGRVTEWILTAHTQGP